MSRLGLVRSVGLGLSVSVSGDNLVYHCNSDFQYYCGGIYHCKSIVSFKSMALAAVNTAAFGIQK